MSHHEPVSYTHLDVYKRQEHDQIVDAIERHDEVAAETAMRQHINNAFIFKKANAEVQHKKLNEV